MNQTENNGEEGRDGKEVDLKSETRARNQRQSTDCQLEKRRTAYQEQLAKLGRNKKAGTIVLRKIERTRGT